MKEKEKPEKKKKPSLADLKREALSFYRHKRKRVHKFLWNNQAGVLLATEDSNDNLRINQSYLRLTKGDYNLAAEFKHIEGAFLTLGWPVGKATGLLYLLPELHNHIWPRYNKVRIVKIQRQRKRPRNSSTAIILEALLRGFIHIADAKWDQSKPYIVTEIDDFVWPESYALHQEAIAKRDQVSVAHGSCPTPKDYNYSSKSFNHPASQRGFKL